MVVTVISLLQVGVTVENVLPVLPKRLQANSPNHPKAGCFTPFVNTKRNNKMWVLDNPNRASFCKH